MAHIDYLSVSFDIDDTIRAFPPNDKMETLNQILPVEFRHSEFIEKQYSIISRVPYKGGVHHKTYSYSYFYGGQTTVLLEFSALSLIQFDFMGYMSELYSGGVGGTGIKFNKVTRLDIAQDYDTDISPFDAVVQWTINPKVKTKGISNSRTGSTFYIGSRDSDRIVRVYRYFEPHPRAKTLRCEIQFNKGVAGKVAEQLVLKTATVLDAYARAMNTTFVTPPLANSDRAVVTQATDRQKGTTVAWFYSQVVPALAKLIDSGELSLTDVIMAIDEKRTKD